MFARLSIAWLVLAAVPVASAQPGGAPCVIGTLEPCLQRAQRGELDAQVALAVMYNTGRGVRENAAEAARWYRRAADKGLAHAQFNLALMFASGRGVARDDLEAARWYRRAAVQGHAGAQAHLGAMYQFGRGVHQNAAEAVRWYRQAAAKGVDRAEFSLGESYELGLGVPVDVAQAARWYRRAADQGLAQAQENLANLLRVGGRDLPKDSVEAVRWYRLAAAQGHATAQDRLGLMYVNGEGVTRNDARGYLWLTVAAARISRLPGRESDANARAAAASRLTSEERLAMQQLAARCTASGFRACGEPSQ